MASDPSKAPPGATPVLPEPTGVAAHRAADLFRRVLEKQSVESQEDAPSPGAPPTPSATVATATRSYPLALAAVARCLGQEEPPRLAAPTEPSQPVSQGESPQSAPAPARPPAGAPAVRPSPTSASRRPVERVDDLIAKGADTAWLHGDRNAATFEVTFRNELFADLRCRIAVAEGRVTATFLVTDNDTRRLLEAEAGRLRVQLEERGLRVDAVNVQQVAAD